MITHDSLLTFLKEKEDFTMFSDNEFLKMIFSNYKPSSKKGWLLSSYGLTLLSKYMTAYPVTGEYVITLKDMVTLSKMINSPYHIDNKKKTFTTFDSTIYTIVLLGGVETLLAQL